MKLIKATPKHKLGNMISGACSIFDGVVVILTLGSYHPSTTLSWNIYRLSTGKLYDKAIQR